MIQLILNISDPSIVPSLRKVLRAIDGVTIARQKRSSRKCGLDEALEEIKKGDVERYDTADDFFKAMGI